MVYAVGIEIGGTKLQVAIGTSEGKILRIVRGRVESGWGAREILDWVTNQAKELISISKREGLIPSAVGVGFGGPVDSHLGKVLISHQVSGWQGFPLKDWFESQCDLPSIVVNDANSAGWAEYQCGFGQGTKNFFYMNIGSGIGGALVINGQLYDGQGYGAGEIGHTYVPDWTKNYAGAFDKLENICSGWNIEKRLRTEGYIPQNSKMLLTSGGNKENLNCALLGACAMEGDEFALKELDRLTDSISIAVSNVITLFHPEKVAIGGGVSLMGEPLFGRLRDKVDKLVFGPFQGRYEIGPCVLSEQVVLVGAVLLASKNII